MNIDISKYINSNEQQLCLNGTESKKYYRHVEYRKFIDKYIIKNKLTLSLNFSYTNIHNVCILGSVHTLYLNHCYNITNVNSLRMIHKLYLYCCKNVQDVGMLGNVHTLNLVCVKKITNISSLYSVNRLTLSCCANVIDIGNLCLVRSLYLYDYIVRYGSHLLKKAKTIYSYIGNNVLINKIKKLNKHRNIKIIDICIVDLIIHEQQHLL